MTTHQIRFITGSSRGFGWALASAVLEAGDLPVLKRQGSGTIVQFSSIDGRVGATAGLAAARKGRS
jgi:hypothetical protein